MQSWHLPVAFALIFCCGCGDRSSLVEKVPTPPDVESTIEPTAPTAPTTADKMSPSVEAVDVPAVEAKRSGVAKSQEVQVIGFDDLNIGMGENARFRPIMLEYNDGRAKELLGETINIGGHMNPPDQLRGLTEFVLLKNKDCKFGPGGQADHLLRVFMKKGTTVDYTDKVIYIVGRITLKPFPDDSPLTWSIYDVEATEVSTRPPSRAR